MNDNNGLAGFVLACVAVFMAVVFTWAWTYLGVNNSWKTYLVEENHAEWYIKDHHKKWRLKDNKESNNK